MAASEPFIISAHIFREFYDIKKTEQIILMILNIFYDKGFFPVTVT